MSINMQARTTRPAEPSYPDTPIVYPLYITGAITSPDVGYDAEALPLFRCVDANGQTIVLAPEEVQTADGSRTLMDDQKTPDLHPFVIKTLAEFGPYA